MQYTTLGRTGVRVSTLAAGTMAWGNEADVAESARLFARCRDAGINLFDCADVYGKGRSEEVLGGLIAGCRDDIVLTTKAYFPMGEGANDRGSHRYHLVRAVEASLRRLQTDRIDLFFLHRFDDHTPLEETLRALDDLVRGGKILYPAVSNFAAWQVADALGIAALQRFAPLVAIQPMYNLVKRQAEVEILPQAHHAGLAVLPYSPLAGGLLTGKYGRDRRPDSGRLVDNPMYRTRYGAARYYDTADAFVALADEVGVHPVSLAIAWVGSHPAVTAPLIGGRSVAQIEPALAAAEVELDAELRARISALSEAPPPATDRNEEAGAFNYAAVLEAK